MNHDRSRIVVLLSALQAWEDAIENEVIVVKSTTDLNLAPTLRKRGVAALMIARD